MFNVLSPVIVVVYLCKYRYCYCIMKYSIKKKFLFINYLQYFNDIILVDMDFTWDVSGTVGG